MFRNRPHIRSDKGCFHDMNGVAMLRASSIIPSAFRLKTSKLMGSPWKISQISLIRGIKSLFSLEIRVGLVVTPSITPISLGLTDLARVGCVDKEFHSGPSLQTKGGDREILPTTPSSTHKQRDLRNDS